jgi:hypothetical protein
VVLLVPVVLVVLVYQLVQVPVLDLVSLVWELVLLALVQVLA